MRAFCQVVRISLLAFGCVLLIAFVLGPGALLAGDQSDRAAEKPGGHSAKEAGDKRSLAEWRTRLENCAPAAREALFPLYRECLEKHIAPCLAAESGGGISPESAEGLLVLHTAKECIRSCLERFRPFDKEEEVCWLRLAVRVEAALGEDEKAREFAKRYVEGFSLLHEANTARQIVLEAARYQRQNRPLEALVLLRALVEERTRLSRNTLFTLPLARSELLDSVLPELVSLASGDLSPVRDALRCMEYRRAALLSWLFLEANSDSGTAFTEAQLLLGKSLWRMGRRNEALLHLGRVAEICWEPELMGQALLAIRAIRQELQMRPAELAALEAARRRHEEELKRHIKIRQEMEQHLQTDRKRSVPCGELMDLPESMDMALELLAHPDERERKRAKYALASRGAQAVPKLLRALSAKDTLVREGANQVLSTFEGSGYASALLEAVEDRELAEIALARMEHLQGDREVAVIVEAVKDETRSYQQRDFLIEALSETRTATAKQALMALTHDKNPRIRRSALDALTYFKGDEVDGRMILLLRDPQGRVRRQAAECLGRRKCAAAVTPLLDIVCQDKKDGMTFAALHALGEIAEHAVIPRLRLQLLVPPEAFPDPALHTEFLDAVRESIEAIQRKCDET